MPSEIDSFKNVAKYSLAKTNIEVPIIKEKTIMEIFFKLIIIKVYCCNDVATNNQLHSF